MFAGGNVTLTAFGSVLNGAGGPAGAATVHGNTINLNAINGTIGVVGHDITVDSQFGGSGVVNANAPHNIYVIETNGDLNLGTVTVTGIGSDTAHLVARVRKHHQRACIGPQRLRAQGVAGRVGLDRHCAEVG